LVIERIRSTIAFEKIDRGDGAMNRRAFISRTIGGLGLTIPQSLLLRADEVIE
jgi:hypothetical protein